MISEINRKVIFNTSILFIRMVFVVGIGLLSVRLLIKNLGVEDYGIYIVLFGYLGILAFFTNSITEACQRFFSIEIQKNDYDRLSAQLAYTILLALLLMSLFVSLSETVGLNIVISYFTIPQEKVDDVKNLYHKLVILYSIQIVTIPFNSLLLAFEKIKMFSYISVAEACLKFVAASALALYASDPLPMYGTFMLCIGTAVFSIHIFYCNYAFSQMIKLRIPRIASSGSTNSFISWNLMGSFASVIKSEGTNSLLNIFYGPILNAARGIAFQVHGVINMFALNITQIVKLQIYKYYADSNFEELKQLVLRSTKYQCLVVAFISFPFIFETKFILDGWLTTYPQSAIMFTKLALLLCIIDSLSYTLMAAVLATGRIGRYTFTVSALILTNIFFSYLLLQAGYFPEIIVVVAIAISFCALFVRLSFYAKYYSLKLGQLTTAILRPTLATIALASFAPFLIITFLDPSVFRFLFATLICALSLIIFTYFIALDATEKATLRQAIAQIRSKLI